MRPAWPGELVNLPQQGIKPTSGTTQQLNGAALPPQVLIYVNKLCLIMVTFYWFCSIFAIITCFLNLNILKFGDFSMLFSYIFILTYVAYIMIHFIYFNGFLHVLHILYVVCIFEGYHLTNGACCAYS